MREKQGFFIGKKGKGKDWNKRNALQTPPNKDKLWWCPTCGKWVSGVDVTYWEYHDINKGGCGNHVT